MSNEFLAVAKLGAPHGLKGQIKVIPFINPPELILDFAHFYLEDIENNIKVEIEDIKPHKNNYLLKLNTYNNIADVESLTHKKLLVKKNDLPELPKGRYYIGDLISCEVFDENQKKLGVIEDVLQYSANDIYIIKDDLGSFMLPAVKEFIKEIDINNKVISVILPVGIRDL
jgi:16S rRNA processing protein RimM